MSFEFDIEQPAIESTDTFTEETNEEKFLETFGEEPDLVAAAPGRVNLSGEHIDYSDGFVLPFAIKDRTFVAARKRDDSKVRIASAQRRSKGNFCAQPCRQHYQHCASQ